MTAWDEAVRIAHEVGELAAEAKARLAHAGHDGWTWNVEDRAGTRVLRCGCGTALITTPPHESEAG